MFKALSLLPLSWCRGLGSIIGHFSIWINARSAKTTRQNLALCFSEKSEAERKTLFSQSMIHTTKTLMETPAVWLGRLPKRATTIQKVENEQQLMDDLASDQGLLILLPHLGNWEVLNVYLASKGIEVTALYKDPSQPWMRSIMSEVRSHFGNKMVPTTVQGIAQLFKVLKRGGTVVVLPDQVPASGEFVSFFGEPALTDRLASKLIVKCNARAICCTVPRVAGGFVVKFAGVEEAIYSTDLLTSMRGLNASIESCVRPDLAQYQWAYKRFKMRPDGAPQIYD